MKTVIVPRSTVAPLLRSTETRLPGHLPNVAYVPQAPHDAIPVTLHCLVGCKGCPTSFPAIGFSRVPTRSQAGVQLTSFPPRVYNLGIRGTHKIGSCVADRSQMRCLVTSIHQPGCGVITLCKKSIHVPAKEQGNSFGKRGKCRRTTPVYLLSFLVRFIFVALPFSSKRRKAGGDASRQTPPWSSPLGLVVPGSHQLVSF